MRDPKLSTALVCGLFTSAILLTAAAQAEYQPGDARCQPHVVCYAACVDGKTHGFDDSRVSPGRQEYKEAAKAADKICAAQCSAEPQGREDDVRKACAIDSYEALLRGDITIVN
ncbi:hypothetical protein OEG84_03020 [Hoeflea sp. G2-23]|uniref:Secreted protein n=1 Tax=Hoeflea algicola TaxID=2983763 RepID=A0ABT3Z4L5_9HYPH|nr:hypothetical protein [Hoeflea algicola]MCY0146713.1 hypothetical protein [Hoeflea algicola]